MTCFGAARSLPTSEEWRQARVTAGPGEGLGVFPARQGRVVGASDEKVAAIVIADKDLTYVNRHVQQHALLAEE